MGRVSSASHSRIDSRFDSDTWLPHLQSGNIILNVVSEESGDEGPMYLIERREDVIGKLYFSNGCGPCIRNANAKASDALFTQWRVEYSILAVFFLMGN